MFYATEIIFVVKNNFQTSVLPPRFYHLRRRGTWILRPSESMHSEPRREVTTPLCTGICESAFNDTAGLTEPEGHCQRENH
jgi:hypothetical protein